MPTMTEKILSKKLKRAVKSGELIEVDVDIIMGNDITAPVAISELHRVKAVVKNPEKVFIVLDHFVPPKDIKSAEQCKICRDFAKANGVVLFENIGIEHVILPEKGLVLPEQIIIGADSHTCTYGALGAFSAGVGSTDMAYAMKTSKAWFKVPSAVGVRLHGKLKKFVSGKDVILHLIGILGVEGALYKSLEFFGDGLLSLTIEDRFTICNMAIECGAKNGIFAVDDITINYVKEKTFSKFEKTINLDIGAYERIIDINLSELNSVVACPHLPSNIQVLPFKNDVLIDQVVIGSCTNGRVLDIEKAVGIINGRKIAPTVRLLVIPGSMQVYKESLKRGYIEKIIDAGGVFAMPTCGPCLGGYLGILAANEVCLATTNRNFIGRMGDVNSKVYLCNPEVAMASAISGKIVSAEEVIQ